MVYCKLLTNFMTYYFDSTIHFRGGRFISAALELQLRRFYGRDTNIRQIHENKG